MSTALWFLIAVLLYSSLATEALTCFNCHPTGMGYNCISRTTSKTCTADLGQLCKITKYFVDGKMKAVFRRGCTATDMECDVTMTVYEVGTFETTCCDDHDFCNLI